MDLKQAATLAREHMNKHGLHHWSFRFNGRLTRALGRCCYHNTTIELQPRYVELNSVTEVLDTILHEIAHALCPRDGHGDKWKATAARLGATPSPYAGEDVVVPPKKWRLVYVAECGKVEPLRVYSNRRTNYSRAHLRGRPETLGRLRWIPNTAAA